MDNALLLYRLYSIGVPNLSQKQGDLEPWFLPVNYWNYNHFLLPLLGNWIAVYLHADVPVIN